MNELVGVVLNDNKNSYNWKFDLIHKFSEVYVLEKLLDVNAFKYCFPIQFGAV